MISALSQNDFTEAKKRISSFLKPTPLIKSDILQKILKVDYPIYLKLESEQPTGSFKVRGAFNALLLLPPSVENVVAFSSGNFAQAVAFGAQKLNKKATIVMPSNAPSKKIEGTKSLGAEIVFCGEKHEDGEIIVKELVEKKGYYPLHPFNHYHTIFGQGTVALEIIEEAPDLKHFFSPVGGGGLLSGAATVLNRYNKLIEIYSVEPVGAEDFHDSFYEKNHLAFDKTNTIADGLRAASVGKLNFPILMKLVNQPLVVAEGKIIDAMRLLFKEHNLVIEPSGAVALAGFLSVHENLTGDAVILVTGKNVDPNSFKQWVPND